MQAVVMENETNPKTIKKLDKKYNSKRTILLGPISKDEKPWQRVLTIVLDIFFGALVIFSGIFCFNIINNRAQGTPVSLCGYNAMRIVSASMLPDHKVGDCIMVHSVNPHSLNVGDSIAFYVFTKDSNLYQTRLLTTVSDEERSIEYTFNYNQILGVQTKDICEAAQNGATLVFHKIEVIEQDETGCWWFTTKGTNNASIDNWRIQEQYVVGVYVDNSVAAFFAKLLNNASRSLWFLLVLIIPVASLAFLIMRSSIKDVQLAKLELDCIEEKRRITDPICVKNKIGRNMSKRDKFKVLATAPDESKMEYVNLLWEPDKVPSWIHKYYLKQGALLRPIQKLRDINRECEKMYRDGMSLAKVGAYYDKERAKIETQVKLRYKRISKMK